MASSVDHVAGGAGPELKVVENVGDLKRLPKLQAALKKLPLSFCGAPGVGKNMHLLTMAAAKAGRKLIVDDLAHISSEHGTRVADLERVLSRCESNDNLDGKRPYLHCTEPIT